jgi:hypothetical protein
MTLIRPCCLLRLQDRWLENRECGYVQGAELSEGERRIKRFAPFSDGIKNCLGQVRGAGGVCLRVRTDV